MRLSRIILALLAGAVVALTIYLASSARVQDAQGVNVVVASRDLAARTLLDANALRVVVVPRGDLSTGAITSIDDAVRRVLRDPLYAGEILDERHLAARNTEFSASLLIPNDKPYAFNLPVTLFLSVPPRLQLHDRIDIIGYAKGQSLDKGGVIVADLEVIDLSGRVADNATDSTYLTVGATADDIVRILAARDQYALGLALRPFARPGEKR